ncbi:MAG: tRNA pseudouridine(38-40) synthase TruA [bacterium]
MEKKSDYKKYIKMTVEYEGTDFAGWQVQPEQRTVQEEIEAGLFKLTEKKFRVTAAGRTDAGVHALGQVVSFGSDSKLPVSAFSKGLNKYLPEDIRVIEAEEKTEKFDARRNAISRTYRYVISTRPKVIGRRYSWYPHCNFLLDPMIKASESLKGEHNYASFCKKTSEGYFGNISTVHRIEWKTFEDIIFFEVTAVRFLHNMIRIIVGTLLEVGRVRLTPEDFKNILEARNRKLAGPTAPPQGLYLVSVQY